MYQYFFQKGVFKGGHNVAKGGTSKMCPPPFKNALVRPCVESKKMSMRKCSQPCSAPPFPKHCSPFKLSVPLGHCSPKYPTLLSLFPSL